METPSKASATSRRKRSREGNEWKQALEPWARLYAGAHQTMVNHLAGMSDERLEELARAVEMPGRTNCWWATYNVAKELKPEIQFELRTRAQKRMARAPHVDSRGYVWQLGEDGLMHSPETIPYKREYIEKKWGPLEPVENDASR